MRKRVQVKYWQKRKATMDIILNVGIHDEAMFQKEDLDF